MKITVKTDAGYTAIAHIKDDDGIYRGILYPVTKCHYPDGRSSLQYESSTNCSDYFDEPNDTCKIYFKFIFQYRGVWEGRIYFPNDEEFWSEEISVMANLWSVLEDNMQKMIMETYPGYYI